MSEGAAAFTDDAVLGGRLRLRQPRRGHRVGHDAILLAAATAACAGEQAVELGAGVGAAGLALALRVERLRVALVECDPALVALAGENVRRNAVAGRVRAIALDAAASAREFAAAGLPAGSADRVLMNPPFNDPARHRLSPDGGRRAAHAGSAETLPQWVRTAFRLLGAGGVMTLIWRADELPRVLGVPDLCTCGLAVLPVHARADRPAIRILVRATKGSRASFALHPGLVLSEIDGHPTAAAEAVLRHGAVLSLAEC
jgi:tRNA1(Val) A37 N6-methylase TrmN6